MSLEQQSYSKENSEEDFQVIEKSDRLLEKEKNEAFEGFMYSKLLDGFSAIAEKLNWEKEQIKTLRDSLINIGKEDQALYEKLLILPREVKEAVLLKKTDPAEIIDELKEDAEFELLGQAAKIGFHTSDKDIEITTDSKGIKSWTIFGTEKGDLSNTAQAFAAEKFSGIYTEKKVKNLYVVRLWGDRGLYDSRRGWHHANSFAIVDKFDLQEIKDGFEEMYTEDKYAKVKKDGSLVA